MGSGAMKVRVKFYASLGQFLPPGAVKNEAEIEVPDGTTPHSVMENFNLPLDLCKLVLINGVYVMPEERATRTLVTGDVLAVWPPVAGG